MKTVVQWCFAVSLLGLVACSQQSKDENISKSAQKESQKVVVFSSRKQHLIDPLFKQFTAETGIEVDYITDKAQPLLARLSASKARPEADLFMSVDAGSLWSAQEQGLLQPVASPVLDQRVPPEFRDNQGHWFGLSKRARTIVYSTERVEPKELESYEQLAAPQWKGRLCLRTSQKVYNQSLVAMLVAEQGEDTVAHYIKGWVENLATPVFSSDSLLIQAIASGQCDVGIVNTYYLAQELAKNEALPVGVFWANQGNQGVHMNISGAGLVKDAPHRAAAITLLDWLVSDSAQQKFAGLNYEFPIVEGIALDPLVQSWGEFKGDDASIENAGRFQAKAIMVMDSVGYK